MKKWGMALLCALSLALPAAAQEQGAQWGFIIPVTIRDTRIGGCRIWAAPYREGGEPADPGFENAPVALEVPVERYGAVQEVFLPGGTPPSADATYKIWIQPVPKPAYLGLNLPGTATAVYQYYCVQQLQLPEVLYVPQGKELVLTAAALPAYTTAPITWAVNDPQAVSYTHRVLPQGDELIIQLAAAAGIELAVLLRKQARSGRDGGLRQRGGVRLLRPAAWGRSAGGEQKSRQQGGQNAFHNSSFL